MTISLAVLLAYALLLPWIERLYSSAEYRIRLRRMLSFDATPSKKVKAFDPVKRCLLNFTVLFIAEQVTVELSTIFSFLSWLGYFVPFIQFSSVVFFVWLLHAYLNISNAILADDMDREE